MAYLRRVSILKLEIFSLKMVQLYRNIGDTPWIFICS